VVAIIRFKEDDLVAGIQERQTRGIKRASSA
jgi:hypothetical protein